MISNGKATTWFSFLTQSRRRPISSRRNRTTLLVEQLEDRWVPSGTPLDLTSPGAAGQINGAIFRQFDQQPAGTGVIDSFVRLQAHGNASSEQGYNTDFRPLQFDENNSPQFTRSLQLGSIPKVIIGGVVYREFLLDINQKNSQSLLSLDELRVYVGGQGNLHNYNATTHQLDSLSPSSLSPVYDLDAGVNDSWIKLDAGLSHGSGQSDMVAYIPEAKFAGAAPTSYIYLYSKFGTNIGTNGGFEEWAVAKSAVTAATGSISGTVFVGLPPNNVSYTGGATVYIDANSNGMLDANEVSTVTAANGTYSFTNLATGTGAFGSFTTYNIVAVAPSGYSVTPPARIVALTTPGQAVTGQDFYLTFVQQTYMISGRVNDLVGSPYMVILYDATAMTTQTLSFSATSSYSFTNLIAHHDYTVSVVPDFGVPHAPSYTFNNLRMDQVANFTISDQ